MMDLLAEIRAAFPTTPYPGDAVLSGCWCDECAWSMRHIRGKSWKQLRLGDVGGDGGHLSPGAFCYYLPGLLCLAVQHPEETFLESAIVARLFVYDKSPPGKVEEVRETVRRLSPRQREALARYLLSLRDQEWQSPLAIEAALAAVRDGKVIPVSMDEYTRWLRELEASLRGRDAAP